MSGVHVPSMQKSDSILDVIGKGLQIAQTVYGIKNSGADQKRKDEDLKREYAKDFDRVDPGTTGATETEIGGEKVSWLPRKKEAGIKPPGTRAIQTVDANGKPITQIVEDKPGLTLPSYVKPEKPKDGGAATPKLTAGETTLDKEFAKEYNDWTSGGAKTAQTEIMKLKSVADNLRDKAVTTGGMTGMFPDRMTSNAVLKARADVESTVMNSLKVILGNAFTEKEGQRIIKATWNEADTTENNLSRIERLIADLENKAISKNEKADYFSENGTLKGWKSGNSGVAGNQQQAPKQRSGEAFAAPASDKVPTLDLNAIDAELKRRGVKAGASGGW